MKGKFYRILTLALAVIFVCSCILLLRQYWHTYRSAGINQQAQELASTPSNTPPETTSAALPEDTSTPPTEETTPETTAEPTEPPDDYVQELQTLDLNNLQAANPDVIGWMYLPDTQINYPLLYAGDNDAYLYTAWDGTYNVAGSIFLEARNDPMLSDFNTIIYGHNMRDGSMFASLLNYKDRAFLETHPNVYIATGDGIFRYSIFSSYEAPVVSDTYRLIFKNDTEMQTAINHYESSSVWECPFLPTCTDSILTLSTCTGNGQYETRWVIQAMLTGFWEYE